MSTMAGRTIADTPPTGYPSSRPATSAVNTMGSAKRKCTRLAKTDTMGISSAGNTALRMSPELATRDMAPSRVEAEVQIQGNSPLTRNRAYGSAP